MREIRAVKPWAHLGAAEQRLAPKHGVRVVMTSLVTWAVVC